MILFLVWCIVVRRVLVRFLGYRLVFIRVGSVGCGIRVFFLGIFRSLCGYFWIVIMMCLSLWCGKRGGFVIWSSLVVLVI